MDNHDKTIKTVQQGIPKNHVTRENCKVGMRVERGRDYGTKWNTGTAYHEWVGQGEFDDYHYGIPGRGYITSCRNIFKDIGTASVEWDHGEQFKTIGKKYRDDNLYIGGEVKGVKRYDLQIVKDNGRFCSIVMIFY